MLPPCSVDTVGWETSGPPPLPSGNPSKANPSLGILPACGWPINSQPKMDICELQAWMNLLKTRTEILLWIRLCHSPSRSCLATIELVSECLQSKGCQFSSRQTLPLLPQLLLSSAGSHPRPVFYKRMWLTLLEMPKMHCLCPQSLGNWHHQIDIGGIVTEAIHRRAESKDANSSEDLGYKQSDPLLRKGGEKYEQSPMISSSAEVHDSSWGSRIRSVLNSKRKSGARVITRICKLESMLLQYWNATGNGQFTAARKAWFKVQNFESDSSVAVDNRLCRRVYIHVHINANLSRYMRKCK